MTETLTVSPLQALQQFWEGFGLTAYEENTVPDQALTLNGGKYISYEERRAGFDEPVAASASLWYRSRSWTEILAKAEEIFQALQNGGILLPYTGGALWVTPGAPCYQRMPSETEGVRRVYINVNLEFL
ncbi:MAG: hypothetical protein IKD93_02520 [Firmicutes bacterium]|nr:hypothetical protein [Bacillota bacterium]